MLSIVSRFLPVVHNLSNTVPARSITSNRLPNSDESKNYEKSNESEQSYDASGYYTPNPDDFRNCKKPNEKDSSKKKSQLVKSAPGYALIHNRMFGEAVSRFPNVDLNCKCFREMKDGLEKVKNAAGEEWRIVYPAFGKINRLRFEGFDKAGTKMVAIFDGAGSESEYPTMPCCPNQTNENKS